MTDDEIIKALKYCSTDVRENTCPKCVFYKKNRCITLMLNGVSDLINRQKAEIERLKNKNTLLLKKKCKDINMARKIIKHEAIKEFAEEFEYFVLNEGIEVVEPKCKDYESYINGANQFRYQIKNGINNIIKEMTEGL